MIKFLYLFYYIKIQFFKVETAKDISFAHPRQALQDPLLCNRTGQWPKNRVLNQNDFIGPFLAWCNGRKNGRNFPQKCRDVSSCSLTLPQIKPFGACPTSLTRMWSRLPSFGRSENGPGRAMRCARRRFLSVTKKTGPLKKKELYNENFINRRVYSHTSEVLFCIGTTKRNAGTRWFFADRYLLLCRSI